MKRFVWLFAVLAFVIAIPAVEQAAVKKEEKVALCHKGNVIVVARSAVEAHKAHKDCSVPIKEAKPGAKCSCDKLPQG